MKASSLARLARIACEQAEPHWERPSHPSDPLAFERRGLRIVKIIHDPKVAGSIQVIDP